MSEILVLLFSADVLATSSNKWEWNWIWEEKRFLYIIFGAEDLQIFLGKLELKMLSMEHTFNSAKIGVNPACNWAERSREAWEESAPR